MKIHTVEDLLAMAEDPTEVQSLPAETASTAAVPPVSSENPSAFPWPAVAAALIVVAAAAIVLLCLRRSKPGKYQRKE